MTSVRRLDVALAAVMSVIAMGLMYANTQDESINANALTIPLILLITVPLLWRSAAPIAAAGAVLAGLVLHDLLFGTDVIRCGVVLPVTFLLVFSAAVRMTRRDALIVLALGLASIVAEMITFLGPFGLIFAALAAGIWRIGRIVRSRGEMTEELRARTAELREARDERARMEVTAERARLSSELDSLLQRRLGELAQLAGEHDRPVDPTAAAARLAEIEHESRRTLDEMRAVVGVLRTDSAELTTEPQPTLAHLEALLIHAKGTDARLAVEGIPRVLPAAVELSAYRIVEQLLAAIEDTPDVDVLVRFADGALEVVVAGRARRRAKASIERARERARLQRGTLQATVHGGRAEALVSLPTISAA